MQIKRGLSTVTSYTDRWTTYKIYEGIDGLLHCSCPSSIYQNRECKHLRDFRYAPEYTSWLGALGLEDKVTSEIKSPVTFSFDSSGELIVDSKDGERTIFVDVTSEECKAVIVEMENVIAFMRVYAEIK